MTDHQFKVGDVIEFTDEFGIPRQSIILSTEAYGMQGKLGIKGSFGWYVRDPSEVREVFGHANLAGSLENEEEEN